MPSSKLSDGSGTDDVLPNGKDLQKVNAHLVSISPDSRHLALNALPGATGEDILIVTIDGSAPIRDFAKSAFHEVSPMFSPDGKWIAYASDESGRFEIYVQPFSGPGGKWQISADGGTEPVWARNGKELFYRSERKMMAVPLQTAPTFAPGRAQLLFEADFVSSHRNHPNYDVGADGRFLMIKADLRERAPQLHVIVNLGAELLKHAPPQK